MCNICVCVKALNGSQCEHNLIGKYCFGWLVLFFFLESSSVSFNFVSLSHSPISITQTLFPSQIHLPHTSNLRSESKFMFYSARGSFWAQYCGGFSDFSVKTIPKKFICSALEFYSVKVTTFWCTYWIFVFFWCHLLFILIYWC